MSNALVHITTSGLEIDKIMVLWDLMLYASVDGYQGFGGTVNQSENC
jgi:hypothetical protein